MRDGKKITIRDVAKFAEVSISSVSRYLADSQSVRPLAAYNIKNAIRELKFEPNGFARNLKKRRADSVGVLVPHMDYFCGKACGVISDYFYERKFSTFICESDNDPAKERFCVQSLLNLHVAGMIVMPSGRNTEYLREVADRHRNIVVINRREDIGCDIVAMDFDKSAYLLTRHVLAAYPCDRITLLLGARGGYHMLDCLKGIRRAFREAGRPFARARQVYDCFKFNNVAGAVRDVVADIRRDERPAILAFGSSFVEDMIIVLNQCGENALRRVDIAGFATRDIIDKLGFHFPCVMQNPDKAGTTASELLYGKITGAAKGRKRKTAAMHEIAPDFRLEK